MSKTFSAIATLIGTVIGAGILGIPYVIMKSGFGFGLLNMILVFIIMIITMLYLGEISLRTKNDHHLPGYAEKYLGKKGKIIMFLAFAFGIYSAILAYLIGEGDSLSFIFFNNTNHQLIFGFIFWLFLSLISYYGLKALEDGEEIGIILILVMIVAIAVFAWNKIDVSNLTYNNTQYLFFPFGVVLFAFLGFSAIPEISEILKDNKKSMKKTILISYILVFILYLVFTLVVLGFKGTETPQIATLVLGKPFILLGMLTMFTSYLALSFAMIDSLMFDFSLSKEKAWFYTTTIPLILFLILSSFQLASFTKVLSIGGVISGGLTGILILLMVKNAKAFGNRNPEYKIPYSNILTWILIIIFTIGAITQIIHSI